MKRVLGFVVLVCTAVVAMLVVIDDGNRSVVHIGIEALCIGVAAYVGTHLAWSRWTLRSRSASPTRTAEHEAARVVERELR